MKCAHFLWPTPRILALSSLLAAMSCDSPEERGVTVERIGTTAQALSVVNGNIDASEVLSRAQYWVDLGPRYNQGASAPDPQGKNYRTDCSGLVSMAWHLDHSRVTYQPDSLEDVADQIDKDQLQPGDLIMANTADGHALLFEKWDDAAHTRYWGYEFGGGSSGTEPPEHNRINAPGSAVYWTNDGRSFAPYHYRNLASAAAQGPSFTPAYRRHMSVDVNGDRLGDVCGRGSEGISCEVIDTTGNRLQFKGPGWSDASGWSLPEYGSTIRYADINGDGKADVCGRGADGIHCSLSDGNGFPTYVQGPPLSDANGWAQKEYYSTIQFADVNGDGRSDLCARGYGKFMCWLSNGAGFPTEFSGPDLSDPNGWNLPEYYSTIQLPDVNGDGKADLCARSSSELGCWLSNGSAFSTYVKGPAMSDANGWGFVEYYSTIQYADVNGDGKSDLCARGSGGFWCWLSDGSGFSTQVEGPALTDANGWNGRPYYSTIQFADVSGDGKADLCARSAAAFECWLSNGNGFPTHIIGPGLKDADGWNGPEYYSTLQLSDVDGDGKSDVCGRGTSRIWCWMSDGNGFAKTMSGPEWSDSAGWGDARYYPSMHFLGAAPRKVTSPGGGSSGGNGGSGGKDGGLPGRPQGDDMTPADDSQFGESSGGCVAASRGAGTEWPLTLGMLLGGAVVLRRTRRSGLAKSANLLDECSALRRS